MFNIVEKYTLCALKRAGGERALIANTAYTACITAAGFWELLQAGNLQKSQSGHLTAVEEMPPQDCYYTLWHLVQSKPSITLNKWMEDLFLSRSSQLAKIVKDVTSSLHKKDALVLESRKGLFRTKQILTPETSCLDRVILEIRAAFLNNGNLTPETTFLTALLDKSNILKNYFSQYENDMVTERVKDIRKDPTATAVGKVLEDIDIILTTVMTIFASS